MQKCTVSFTTDNGREVHAGDIVSNEDPVITGREDRFVPFTEGDAAALADVEEVRKSMPHVQRVEEDVAKDQAVGTERLRVDPSKEEDVRTADATLDVEEATANPGERRNTRKGS